jgi:hypothetical protein
MSLPTALTFAVNNMLGLSDVSGIDLALRF